MAADWIFQHYCLNLNDETLTSVRKTITLLALSALLFMACSEEDVPALPNDLIREIRVYDLSNEGDGSDIRVDFSVWSNAQVVEFRLIFLLDENRPRFDLARALAVDPAAYSIVEPQEFDNEYSIKRLSAGLRDSEGVPIQNGIEYGVAILVIGKGNSQLSKITTPFTLRNQGFYDGLYWITHKGRIWDNDSLIHVMDEFFLPGDYFLVQIRLDSGKYSGTPICRDCGFDDNMLVFTAIEQRITDFSYVFTWTCPSCTAGPICNTTFIGDGIITDDLNLEAFTSGAVDCMNRRYERDFKLVRQPDALARWDDGEYCPGCFS